MKQIEQALTSIEVAEMVGKEHNKLLRDIRSYIEQLGESNIGHTDFFKEDVYQSAQGKTLPCYKITKKGCEFVAHKLTGVKGTEFTAKYIDRFHEMQDVISQATIPQGKELLALAVLEAQKTIEDQSRQIGIMKPKADYTDYILSAPGTVTISQIAADYNISAQRLNKILHEERIQYYVNKQWILYKKHMGKGYTKSETFGFNHADGRPDVKIHTRWTQKGRLMINEVLNDRGIYADMDTIGSRMA